MVVVVVGVVVVVVGVVVVGDVVVVGAVVVLVPLVVLPDVLTDVVTTEPSVLVVVAFALVKLPAASSAYCAVPAPPPQATSKADALATADKVKLRKVVRLRDTFNIS